MAIIRWKNQQQQQQQQQQQNHYLLTRLNETYKLYLIDKANKFSKASKTVKTPKNGDRDSVTVRYPKTASNLLKPITQSKIITQELETVEK